MSELTDRRTWAPPDEADEAPVSLPPGAGPRAPVARGARARPASRRPQGATSVARSRPVDEAAFAQATAPPPRLPLPSWIGPAFEHAAAGPRSVRPKVSAMPPDDGWDLEFDQLLETAEANIFHWQPSGGGQRSAPPGSVRGAYSREGRASGAPRARAASLGPSRYEPPRPGRFASPTSRTTPSHAALEAVTERAPMPSFAASNPGPVHVSGPAPDTYDPELWPVPDELSTQPAPGPRDEASAAGAAAEAAGGDDVELGSLAPEPDGPAPPPAFALSRGPRGRRGPTPPPLPDPPSEPIILLSTIPPLGSSTAMQAAAYAGEFAADDEVAAGEDVDPGEGGDAPSEASWAPPDEPRLPAPPRRPNLAMPFVRERPASADAGPASAWGASGRRGGGSVAPALVLRDPFPAAPAGEEGAAPAPALPLELTADEIAAVHGRTLWARLTRRRR